MPVPLKMAGFAIRSIPDEAFEEMQKNANKSLAPYISKDMALLIYEESRDILERNKGLEIVHVEAADGTFVSIVL